MSTMTFVALWMVLVLAVLGLLLVSAIGVQNLLLECLEDTE